jgi:hypothetical protein
VGPLTPLTNAPRLTDTFRGLPGGYLSTLEQRLSDTETVLFDAITELQRVKENMSPHLSFRAVHLNSARPSKITRTSRPAEWSKYPLKCPEDVEHRWMSFGEKDGDNIIPGTFIVPKVTQKLN